MIEATTVIGERYAKALILSVDSDDRLDAIRDDFAGLRSLIHRSKDLKRFIGDPVHAVDKTVAILKSVFGRHIANDTLNFLAFLVGRDRLRDLPAIIMAFDRQLRVRRQLKVAYITTKQDLSRDQMQRLKNHLQQRWGETVDLHLKVQPDLKGGIKVRIGDFVYDHTLEHTMDRFYKHLMSE